MQRIIGLYLPPFPEKNALLKQKSAGQAYIKNLQYKVLQVWQGRKASNPGPTVLETVALPAELHPYINLILSPSDVLRSPKEAQRSGFLRKEEEGRSGYGAFGIAESGMERVSSDVVVGLQGLEPRTDRL